MTREQVPFDSQFQRVQLTVIFWFGVRQISLVAAGMYGRAAYLMEDRKEGERDGKLGRKENEEEKEEALGTGLCLLGTPPVTPFLPVGDASPCHPLVHQYIHHLSHPSLAPAAVA